MHQRYVAADATFGVLLNDFKSFAPSHSGLSGSNMETTAREVAGGGNDFQTYLPSWAAVFRACGSSTRHMQPVTDSGYTQG